MTTCPSLGELEVTGINGQGEETAVKGNCSEGFAVLERMEGLQTAANMNIQIAFYLPDTLLPNGSIFHISTNCVGNELGSQRCCPQ